MSVSYSGWKPREFGAAEPAAEQPAEQPAEAQPGPPGQEGEQATDHQAPSEGFVYDDNTGEVH